MDRDEEQRQAFEAFYEALSPEERRGRVFLKPEFRDAYNELVEADRQFPVPTYLWEKWVPALGVFPVAVYLELRRMCFVNRATGERRDWCWPKQETLAKRLGVKKRQTVGEALRVLEEHGFIRREKSYRRRGGDALMQRGSDRYLVFFEIPLVAADAVELLVRQTTPKRADGGALQLGASGPGGFLSAIAPADRSAERTNRAGADKSVERTYGAGPVDNSPDGSEKRTDPAVRETDSRTVTRINTPNVTNVDSTTSKASPLRNHPAVQAMTPAEREKRESLTLEIGDSLLTWTGRHSGGPHPSEGFHRRVAFLLSEGLIREALMATRDAVDRQRGGEGGCANGPSAYFAGVVKKLAEEEGVDLGLNPRPTPRTPVSAPRSAATPRPRREETSGMEDHPMEPQAARKAIQELLASLAAKENL